MGVTDGDTVTVLDRDKRQHNVRVAGIDAPENGQPFGDRSRQHLASLVLGRNVRAECGKRDRYGGEVRKVLDSSRDAGLEQIRDGMAWWYHEYAREPSPGDREHYVLAEQEVGEKKGGPWCDPDPVPPWPWRRSKRVSGFTCTTRSADSRSSCRRGIE